jgi:O-antigen/teichoic acid export membrane protein
VLALGDRWVIQLLDGRAAVGRYQAAYTLGSVGLSLVTALYNALPPIIYGQVETRQWENLAIALSTTKLLAAPLAAALAIGGPGLLVLVVPASYDPHSLSGVVAAVSASTLPWAVYGIRTGVLIWNKRAAVIAWVTICAAAVNILLVWLLLPPFGLTGAAVATLLAYALLAALMWLATRHEAPGRRSTRVFAAWMLAGALIVLGAAVPVTGAWIPARLLSGATIAVLEVVIIVRLLRPTPPRPD